MTKKIFSGKMTLFIVATPIGNLGDITIRALDTLRNVDCIACEDTRQTKKLLDAYDIRTPMTSFHSFSSDGKREALISEMKNGKMIALVSDAGTPGISDPAFALTSRAHDEGVSIIPIPGASAFLTALSGAGVPIDKFVYLGFLPVKKGKSTVFSAIAAEMRTVVFYESPHRIARTLSDLSVFLGAQRLIIIARELTKLHEEFRSASIGILAEEYAKKPPKGELVVIIPAPSRK